MKWTPSLLKQHYDERLNRLDAEFTRKFDGFPQEYATKNETDALRTLVSDIRTDHATRREVDDLNNVLDNIRSDHVTRREMDEVKQSLSETSGRRAASLVAISVIVTIFAVTFGFIFSNNITHEEITSQIKVEAPWVVDKTEVERRITALERQLNVLQLQVTQIKAIQRVVCQALKLASC